MRLHTESKDEEILDLQLRNAELEREVERLTEALGQRRKYQSGDVAMAARELLR